MFKRLCTLALLLGVSQTGLAERTAAPADASAYIISPAHGEVVSSPVTVRFGLEGFGVAPAGVDRDNTGHHHLLINVDELPPMDQPIPSDEQHRHFGGGQTQVELDLEPGEYRLQLLMGDQTHTPHDPPVKSEPITIRVR